MPGINKKVEASLQQMDQNKAPGLDGILRQHHYQKNIREGVLEAIKHFFINFLYCYIVKTREGGFHCIDPGRSNMYNFLYKLINKIMTVRLKQIILKLILIEGLLFRDAQ